MNEEKKVYTAVPIEVEQDHVNILLQPFTTAEKRSGSHPVLNLLKLISFSILFLFSLWYILPEASLKNHYKHSKAGDSKSNDVSPTLLPGGGRDWTIDTTNQIITSKLNPSLALGSLRQDPLILVHRYETDNISALKFAKTDLEALQKGECVPLDAMSLALQFPNHVDTFSHWDFMLTGVGSEDDLKVDDGEEWNLEYVDENFLLLNGDYALDVSFWKIENGNTVNFVKVSETTKWRWWEKKQETLKYGGGRDWVLNHDDGTISPKGYPYLVLGRGTRSLALMDTNSNRGSIWKFDEIDLENLKNGGVMKLADKESNVGAMKMEEKEKYFEQWRYIESKVSSLSDFNPVEVKYIDDNYISIYEEGADEEKALVLDVSFWIMTPYNSINFVGGWTYRRQPSSLT